MSTDADRRGERTISLGVDENDRSIGPGVFRALALGCVLLLIASFVGVLHDVTRVVGGTTSLFALVAGMLLAATALAHLIRPRTATVAAVTAASLGFAYYLESSGAGVGVVLSETEALFADIVTLATGLPLLRTVEAGVWTLGFVPAPVFLSWYLALRGRYGLSVLPGGFALVFLVLTGDAELTVTLVGTLAAIGAVGFGELDRRGGSISQADLLAVLFALSIVLSLSVSFVPGSETGPTTIGGGGSGTLEGAIDSAGERSGFTGQVDLSPEVRFTVESQQPSYWRTGVYDRFTGDEWVRTGQEHSFDGELERPPGEYETLTQVVTAETELGVMPVAPQPLSVTDGAAQYAEVSAHGQVHPSTTLIEGDSYAVESAVVDPDPAELEQAGTDYPDHVEENYLQLPEDTSDEFTEHAANVTADAETPYGKAVAIESHLRSSKGYSLDVDQPGGNVAEEFVFEMDEGYCIYFATAMAQMLRAEDVPTRYVTGYTSGQQVDENTHVVRGLDAHAWVEVYFPDHGWVAFEPTPSGERTDVHSERLEQAREDGHENVDTNESEDVPIRDTNDDDGDDEPSETDPAGEDDEPNETDPEPDPGSTEPDTESDETSGGDGSEPDPTDDGRSDSNDDESGSTVAISRELVALATVLLVGLAAGIHRTGGRERVRRALGRYWQRPTDDPNRDATRAYRRLERLLSQEYRPRRPSESAQAYVESLRAIASEDGGTTETTQQTESDGSTVRAVRAALPPTRSSSRVDPADPRIEHVLECHEQATYGGGVSREDATTAVECVHELAYERLPFVEPDQGRDRRPESDH